MAKLTLDKLEKKLDQQNFQSEEFPVAEGENFTAEAMYDKYGGSGLEAQVALWVSAHQRLDEFRAFVTSASPPFVNEEEGENLRAVVAQLEALAEFASAQVGAAREAATLVQDVVEYAASKRVSASEAREALKDRILDFGGPVMEDFAAAKKLFSALDLDAVSACVPPSFYDELVSAFEEDSTHCWLLCAWDLHSVPAAILVHVFDDDEIESFTQTVEDEDTDEEE